LERFGIFKYPAAMRELSTTRRSGSLLNKVTQCFPARKCFKSS
jgi:hypothetical protein